MIKIFVPCRICKKPTTAKYEVCKLCQVDMFKLKTTRQRKMLLGMI